MDYDTYLENQTNEYLESMDGDEEQEVIEFKKYLSDKYEFVLEGAYEYGIWCDGKNIFGVTYFGYDGTNFEDYKENLSINEICDYMEQRKWKNYYLSSH